MTKVLEDGPASGILIAGDKLLQVCLVNAGLHACMASGASAGFFQKEAKNVAV